MNEESAVYLSTGCLKKLKSPCTLDTFQSFLCSSTFVNYQLFKMFTSLSTLKTLLFFVFRSLRSKKIHHFPLYKRFAAAQKNSNQDSRKWTKKHFTYLLTGCFDTCRNAIQRKLDMKTCQKFNWKA